MIVRVNVVLNGTVAVDSDWRFDNLCDNHLEIEMSCIKSVDGIIDLIGQLSRDVVGRQLSRDVIGLEDS